jgi:Zn-dependent alcohol dehydrogenase
MAKQKVETKQVKPVVLVDHHKCKHCEPLKMEHHIYCNHMYIRMIMPDTPSECFYF